MIAELGLNNITDLVWLEGISCLFESRNETTLWCFAEIAAVLR
jgi:hypothetical protein